MCVCQGRGRLVPIRLVAGVPIGMTVTPVSTATRF